MMKLERLADTDIALIVFTDGRKDCMERTIQSAWRNLDDDRFVPLRNVPDRYSSPKWEGPFAYRFIHDDSCDPDYRKWLESKFQPLGFEILGDLDQKRGFGGSIAWMWEYVDRILPAEAGYIFHLEDDFVFNRPVGLDDLRHVLAARPHLAQIVLKRQPWNDDERAAGGIIEQHPEDYEQHPAGMTLPRYTAYWLEHRRFFSTNPFLARRELLKRKWPVVERSEGIFTHQLLEDPDLRFAFWGHREDQPWVTHIGTERVGSGY